MPGSAFCGGATVMLLDRRGLVYLDREPREFSDEGRRLVVLCVVPAMSLSDIEDDRNLTDIPRAYRSLGVGPGVHALQR